MISVFSSACDLRLAVELEVRERLGRVLVEADGIAPEDVVKGEKFACAICTREDYVETGTHK